EERREERRRHRAPAEAGRRERVLPDGLHRPEREADHRVPQPSAPAGRGLRGGQEHAGHPGARRPGAARHRGLLHRPHGRGDRPRRRGGAGQGAGGFRPGVRRPPHREGGRGGPEALRPGAGAAAGRHSAPRGAAGADRRRPAGADGAPGGRDEPAHRRLCPRGGPAPAAEGRGGGL
ncbi:MAG: LSU ribosomal protein L10p (P0), partial [uncultured Gemmatimonadetes bacterium]